MKILLALEEAAGIQTLKTVHQSEHDIVAVLTQSSAEADAQRGATVAAVAKNLGYDVWPAKEVKNAQFAQTIKDHAVDVLLNVHSLYIIHGDVVAAPKLGAFNLHPGPLPEYAGMNAPSWAIFNGEKEHGVSLHWMEAGIDTGHIAYQKRFPLKETDTGLTVSTQCVRYGIELVKELLSAASIPKLEQDISKRKYFGFKVPFEGKLDWDLSALVLERFIRASDFYPLPSPWKTPLAQLNDKSIGILKVALSQETSAGKAGTVKKNDDAVFVATADYWLELKRVVVDGKSLKAAEVFSGAEVLA